MQIQLIDDILVISQLYDAIGVEMESMWDAEMAKEMKIKIRE